MTYEIEHIEKRISEYLNMGFDKEEIASLILSNIDRWICDKERIGDTTLMDIFCMVFIASLIIELLGLDKTEVSK